MPYMKISPQNPPGNKINIIFIFIISEQICKKDIFHLLVECCAQIVGLAVSMPVWHMLKCRTKSDHYLSLELLVGTEVLIS